MKKTLFICILAAIVVRICFVENQLNAYKQYYKATENLLDTLELEYNWVDSFDPYEYYDAVENLRD